MTAPNAEGSYQPEKIAAHFDSYGQKEWERLTATPVDEVSLYIHQHYLRQYISAGQRVLEVGAGAGRFTQLLAALGARVLVADISPVQLELNRQFAAKLGFAAAVEDWQQLDICDLSRFADGSFEAVVAYGGPFSYVMERKDQALAECLRVLKPGGPLLLSVMCLWGTAHRNLDGVLAMPVEMNQKVTSSGDLSPETVGPRSQNMHMFRAGELRHWLETSGARVLGLSACGVLSTGWGETLAQVRQEPLKWNELLRMELEASAEPGCLDMGTHLIAVVEKSD